MSPPAPSRLLTGNRIKAVSDQHQSMSTRQKLVRDSLRCVGITALNETKIFYMKTIDFITKAIELSSTVWLDRDVPKFDSAQHVAKNVGKDKVFHQSRSGETVRGSLATRSFQRKKRRGVQLQTFQTRTPSKLSDLYTTLQGMRKTRAHERSTFKRPRNDDNLQSLTQFLGSALMQTKSASGKSRRYLATMMQNEWRWILNW